MADEPFHAFPRDASSLAPACEHAVPELAHGETKVSEGVPITRDAEVANMPAHHGPQPRAHHRNGVMHASLQVGFHRLQLGLHARAVGLPKHGEPSLSRGPAQMREPEKVERSRLSQTVTGPEFSLLAELQQPRLVRVQFEREL